MHNDRVQIHAAAHFNRSTNRIGARVFRCPALESTGVRLRGHADIRSRNGSGSGAFHGNGFYGNDTTVAFGILFTPESDIICL